MFFPTLEPHFVYHLTHRPDESGTNEPFIECTISGHLGCTVCKRGFGEFGTAIFLFLCSQINVIIFSCFINSFSHSRLKSFFNYVDLGTVMLGVKLTTMLLL